MVKRRALTHVSHLGRGGELQVKDVGGKASVLHKIMQGRPGISAVIPSGMVVETSALRKVLASDLEHLQEVVDKGMHADIQTELNKILGLLSDAPMPDDLSEALQSFARDHPGSDFAVRSSAIMEDSMASACAGLFRSELKVPAHQLEDAVRLVWTSAFMPEVFDALSSKSFKVHDVSMAVLIQPMVVGVRASGVAFSRDPKMSRGGFEAVSISVAGGVAGVVDGTADNKELSVHRATLAVMDFTLLEAPVDVVFDDEDARRVAKLAMDLEEHLKIGPLDIEFAFNSEGLYLLQARSDVKFPWKLQTQHSSCHWSLQREMVYIPSGPMAGLCQGPILEGLREGFKSLSSQCCEPVDFTFQIVNGFIYKQRPSFSFGWVLSSLVKIRSFILTKPWERDVQRWHTTVQPELQAAVDGLAEVSVGRLRDPDLEKHIQDCICLLRKATVAHRRFSTSVMPLLDLFSFVRRWMPSFGEKDKMKLIEAIEKGQPKSVRAEFFAGSGERMQSLFMALSPTQLESLQASLQTGEVFTALEAIAGRYGEASVAAKQLLRGAQTWTFGPDVMSPTVYEERTYFLDELERGLAEFDGRKPEISNDGIAAILPDFPQGHRHELEERLTLCQVAGPVREDRFFAHHRAVALLRLALLEAGARSVDAGALKSKEEMLAAPSLQDVAVLMRGDKTTGVAKAYQRLQAASSVKFKAPELLPLQKIPTTASDKSIAWMTRWSKVLRFFPQLSWFTAMQMMLDWKQLDEGLAVEPELDPRVQEHNGLRGISVDELAGGEGQKVVS